MKRLFPAVLSVSAISLLLLVQHFGAAYAQQASGSEYRPPQHLAADAISASDTAILQAHRNELIQSAKIYGYNLEEGNWAYEQTLCSPMPGTILLHYLRQFPDGTSSLFTALVPRQSGRVRIVPVLYRNAAPFVSPAKNPRNYALFNEVVPGDVAIKSLGSHEAGLELGVCYAELTGGRTNVPEGAGIKVAIAGAPLATVYLNPQENITRITFASQQGDSTYRVWSVTFNKAGRVTTASSEDRAVYAPKVAAQQPQIAAASPTPSQPTESSEANEAEPKLPSSQPVPAESKSEPAIATVPSEGTSQLVTAQKIEQPSEPGWKLVANPSQPVATVTPQPPAPAEKITPQPAAPKGWSGPDDLSPK